MRRIERTNKFKRDFKRVFSNPRYKKIDRLLASVLELLVNDEALPDKNFDHSFTGNWKDHRNCHIKPDLILIYRKPDKDTLQLIRLGSHSELGLA